MSTLNEEIARLKTAKANIDRVLIERGISIPENATLDTYHELINSIQSGTSSSKVTATRANVLAGTRTITADSNDKIVEGTMPNNGAVSHIITPSDFVQFYTIPKGYHSGNGKVTVNASEKVYRNIGIDGHMKSVMYINEDNELVCAGEGGNTTSGTIRALDGILMFDSTDGGDRSGNSSSLFERYIELTILSGSYNYLNCFDAYFVEGESNLTLNKPVLIQFLSDGEISCYDPVEGDIDPI